MDNIIKKIVLDLGKKQVELTPEQCKKLKDALDEMFGKSVVKEEHHHHHDRWFPYWHYSTSTITWPNDVSWEYQITDDVSASYSNNAMTLKVT